MPPRPVSVSHPYVICVEGSADKAFFDALLAHLNLTSQVQVIETGGKPGLSARLAAVTAEDYFVNQGQSIGIVLDADNNPKGTFDSICSTLKRVKLPVPVRVMEPVQGQPRIVVTTLPGGSRPGTLEHLCLEMLAADPAQACVDAYLRCLDAAQLAPAVKFQTKARLTALLISKLDDRDAIRLELAVKQSWWDWTHPTFEEVKQFVRLVAGE